MANPFDIALQQEGISGPIADLARSIYMQESGGGRNTATSNAGAVGGMQIIPATFARMADKGWDINDPVQNARAGLRYISKLHDLSGGDPALTAAGYYGGEGAIPKARQGVAVSDPRNPNAPNTLQYGQQVANRLASATMSDANPPTISKNPFDALNAEFAIGAPTQAQNANPFEALNKEFDIANIKAPEVTETKSVQPTQDTSFGRMLGLTGRAAIEGVGSALSAPLEPIRMALESASTAMGGPKVASAETLSSKLANLLQLPKPVEKSVMDTGGGAERFGFDVAKTGFSAIPMMGAAKLASPLTSGTTQQVMNQLAANPAMQGISAAGAGAGGSLAREYGAPPETELLASILGGIAAPPAAGAIKSGINTTARAVAPQAFTTKPEQVDQMITLTLGKSGIDYSKIPEQIQRSLRNDVQNALRTGGDLGGDALRRLLDFRMIEGATPTKGMITLDPRQITLEQNLAKTGMNSTNPDLQTLGNIQNQNNQALINALNARGAGNVRDPYLMSAGEANVNKISATDLAKQQATSALYKQAEGLPGGTTPLNRSELMGNIDSLLAKSNANAFLPENIRGMLNDLSKGETVINGVQHSVPFDTNALDNLMTMIAKAQRSTNDGNTKHALGLVRQAIDQTEIKPIKTEFGGNQLVTGAGAKYLQSQDAQSAELLDALNKARASHKERMNWQESSKPVEFTINGMQPDHFVRKFVLSGDVADAAAVAKTGDPIATKNAILTNLKDKALGGKSDESGTFGADTYNKALKDIGDNKLKLFFSADEIEELKRLGRVAQYMTIQPKGSAVNNSNSGALVLGAGIDALGALGGLPFASTAIGATVGVPILKAGAKKVLGSTVNKMDQKEALNIANALSNKVPGMALGDKVTSGALYGSLLQNPQLMQQLGQRLNQPKEQR